MRWPTRVPQVDRSRVAAVAVAGYDAEGPLALVGWWSQSYPSANLGGNFSPLSCSCWDYPARHCSGECRWFSRLHRRRPAVRAISIAQKRFLLLMEVPAVDSGIKKRENMVNIRDAYMYIPSLVPQL